NVGEAAESTGCHRAFRAEFQTPQAVSYRTLIRPLPIVRFPATLCQNRLSHPAPAKAGVESGLRGLKCASLHEHGPSMSKRQLSRRQSWRIAKIQEERAARAARREERMREELEGGDLGPEQHGLVIAHFGVQVDVEGDDGVVSRCHLRANLPTLVTGDRVVWRAGDQGQGVIVAQLPRTSAPRRADARGQLKPLPASVGRLVIVCAPLPPPHASRSTATRWLPSTPAFAPCCC